ncbi:MAG TPA: NADH:ubiquinone reductase (Na(+)-transporting) subunit B, partial [Candidatus Hydrogenedentes bacterium]|nr:NADH:ubiquinone reductase (Na(+)-transporting) subunit B [Candidatus Hydrogenedentota bacterium]
MRFLRRLLDRQAKAFEAGGRLERFYPLWEAVDAFLYTTGKVTRTSPHVRDGMDLKRIMILVVIALIPCALMAMYNTGLQANLAIEQGGTALGWRGAMIARLGLGFSARSIVACFVHGALYYVPVVL